jgi:hypothetical protein
MSRNPTGALGRLTPETHQAIVDAITAGLTERLAAHAASIGPRSLDRYLARGRTADEQVQAHLANHPDDEHAADLPALAQVPEIEHRYWRLWRDVRRARAERASWRLAALAEAGAGHEAFRRVTTTKAIVVAGKVQMVTEVREERWTERDWRALAWLMEHDPETRDEFAKAAQRLEHSGPDGGPIQTESAESKRDRAAELVQRALTSQELHGQAEAAAASQN